MGVPEAGAAEGETGETLEKKTQGEKIVFTPNYSKLTNSNSCSRFIFVFTTFFAYSETWSSPTPLCLLRERSAR